VASKVLNGKNTNTNGLTANIAFAKMARQQGILEGFCNLSATSASAHPLAAILGRLMHTTDIKSVI
jgi:hypothetical protein